MINLRRVVVTGVGAISPLGNNVKISWSELLKGECAIRNLGPEYEGLPCQVAAHLDKKSLNIEENFTKSEIKSMSSATLLSLLAANEALSDARLLPVPEDLKTNIGVCVGMGMFDLSEVYNSYKSLTSGYNKVNPFFIPRILPNMGSGQISMKHGLKGPLHSVSTACATGAHAIGDAFRFIKYGDSNIMLSGSAESCIDPLSIAGFCRLRALSTSFNDNPKKASRPFDKKRDGFVMGEGAAILVLEELQHALNRNATIYAEILGYGLSGDAHHLTSPSADGSGASLAMLRAIKDASLKPENISYVNAHATSTPTGDKIEARAIQNVFKDNKDLVVSSTKGSHGHLLGASGNLEALFVIMACKEGVIPPSINIDDLDPDIAIDIVTKAYDWKNSRRIALKNSFGFGGTNACLCISNYVE